MHPQPTFHKKTICEIVLMINFQSQFPDHYHTRVTTLFLKFSQSVFNLKLIHKPKSMELK